MAVATNSSNLLVFDLAPDGAGASCSAVLTGHADIILALDAAKGVEGLLASGGKDAQVGHHALFHVSALAAQLIQGAHRVQAGISCSILAA